MLQMNKASLVPAEPARVLPAVFLLSATLLGFETLTIRLVSILVYPVGAYLVISLALLGLGIGGGIVAVRRTDRRAYRASATLGACGSALSFVVSMGAVWLAGRTPLLAPFLPLLLSLPFALGGYALSSCLAMPGLSVNRVYFADLLGAGLAAATVLVSLSVVSGLQLGFGLAALGLTAGSLLATKAGARAGALAGTVALVLSAFALRVPDGIVPVSPKELALMVREQPEAVWEYQRWGPIARVDVLSFPGGCLELGAGVECRLVTQDGGAPTILVAGEGAPSLSQSIFGLPYWLRSRPRVLVIGLGGGPDVVAALQANAIAITGVEVNSRMVELVGTVYADFTGRPYDDPRVTVLVGDGRSYVREAAGTYDVIQLTGVDTSVASLGGGVKPGGELPVHVGSFRVVL